MEVCFQLKISDADDDDYDDDGDDDDDKGLCSQMW